MAARGMSTVLMLTLLMAVVVGCLFASSAVAQSVTTATTTTTTTTTTKTTTKAESKSDSPPSVSSPAKPAAALGIGGEAKPKFIIPLPNNPEPSLTVIGNGVRMQADLPPIVQTPCDGCKTIAAATAGEPLIVTSVTGVSSRVLPNDNLNTVAMRSANSNIVTYSSSSSVSPVRVVSSTSSSPCLPACVSSGCSSTCLHIYSVGGGGGGVVAIGKLAEFQRPTYVSDIRAASVIDQAAENSLPSVVAVPSSSSGACVTSSPCYPSCSVTCVNRVQTSPVRVVSSTGSSTCMSTCMPSCSSTCVQLHVVSSSPSVVAVPTAHTVSVSRNFASSLPSVTAMRTVSTGTADGQPIQVHTVVPSVSVSSSAACAPSCMPSCSASCVHVINTSPMRVVSSTSSSPCAPACVTSGCSSTCLHLYVQYTY